MTFHKELADGRWAKLSFFEQMANIGSEVERAISWKNKGNKEISEKAIERGLELIDLTIMDQTKNRVREIARTREALVDYFYYNNEYGSTDDLWHRYFHAFGLAARAKL